MKTLVVDDSPAMRVFIKRVLQLSGLDVEVISEASNGREALEVVRDQALDLVVCDINMPEMDGEQFLSELAASGLLQQTCVVIVSTDATTSRVNRMLHLGAKGYLKKPFTPEAMRETLEGALGSSYA